MATQAEHSADQLAKWMPRIEEWTLLAAASYAVHFAANASLGVERTGTQVAQALVSASRGDAALMTAVRIYALFDRDEEKVSFQRVKRALQWSDVQDELVKRYTCGNSPIHSAGAEECRSFIEAYLTAYRTIDWDAHHRLSHFRNLSIAHLTERDASRYVTYDELRHFVEVACELQRTLTLIIEGKNTYSRENLEAQKQEFTQVWLAMLQVDEFAMPDAAQHGAGGSAS